MADQSQRIPMSQLASDLIFNAEVLLAIHIQSRKNVAPVYFYQFNYRHTPYSADRIQKKVFIRDAPNKFFHKLNKHEKNNQSHKPSRAS